MEKKIMDEFKNKVVLITGGTSGIGQAAAKAFAREGAKVVVSGRREGKGSEVVRAINSAGGESYFFKADVSDVLWAVFTVLLRHCKLDPVYATASVAVISGLAMLPVFVLTADWAQLLADPLLTGFHAMMQGGVAAGLAVVAFSKAVTLLGASKAGLFPSLVPVLAVILGMPILNEFPSVLQAAGVALASAGLVLASVSK